MTYQLNTLFSIDSDQCHCFSVDINKQAFLYPSSILCLWSNLIEKMNLNLEVENENENSDKKEISYYLKLALISVDGIHLLAGR